MTSQSCQPIIVAKCTHALVCVGVLCGMHCQAEQVEKCDKFEKGLGVVLRNAWQHVEAVQTTDVQTLVHLIGDVLEHALREREFILMCIDKGDLHLRQEVLIFYYIVALMRQLDYLQQDRYMPTVVFQ